MLGPTHESRSEMQCQLLLEVNLYNRFVRTPHCAHFCRHSALGSHDLSILLAIKDSKQLHLHLKGLTVPCTHMCLSLMDHPFQLAPVPIGEQDPPRQTYCLRNGGPAELSYAIDTAPLQQLIMLNHGYEVIAFLSHSPETGADVVCVHWTCKYRGTLCINALNTICEASTAQVGLLRHP